MLLICKLKKVSHSETWCFFTVHKPKIGTPDSKSQDAASHSSSLEKGACCHDNSNANSVAAMLKWRVCCISYAGALHRGKVIQIMESISCDFWSREPRNNKGIKWAGAKHHPLVTDGYLTSNSYFAGGILTKSQTLISFIIILCDSSWAKETRSLSVSLWPHLEKCCIFWGGGD